MVKKAHCYDQEIEKAELQTVITVQCSREDLLSLKLPKSMFMTIIKKGQIESPHSLIHPQNPIRTN